jgi:predicted nucleic acid-binding protein
MVGRLMYLLDTNIVLEMLLDQNRASDAAQLLREIPPEQLHLSEFALYSLGIILLWLGQHETFLDTVQDLIIAGGIPLMRLGAEDMREIVRVAQRFNLDFDDAYQYTVAERYDLTIISFDADFDRTERGRQTPVEVLPG